MQMHELRALVIIHSETINYVYITTFIYVVYVMRILCVMKIIPKRLRETMNII